LVITKTNGWMVCDLERWVVEQSAVFTGNPRTKCHFEVRLRTLTSQPHWKGEYRPAVGRVNALQHKYGPNGPFAAVMIANDSSVPSHSPHSASKWCSSLYAAVVEHIASTDTTDVDSIEVGPKSRGVIYGQSSIIIGESDYFATGQIGARHHGCEYAWLVDGGNNHCS
jgi:hypothetical protein